MDFEPEHDLSFIEEADIALSNFLNLTTDYRLSISELAYNNYKHFRDSVSFDKTVQEHIRLNDKNEIWNYIHPTEIYRTRRPYNERDIYILLACECDREKEHGLQLVFRQGIKPTRISEQDGHLTEADAYDKPDEEDELLSQF